MPVETPWVSRDGETSNATLPRPSSRRHDWNGAGKLATSRPGDGGPWMTRARDRVTANTVLRRCARLIAGRTATKYAIWTKGGTTLTKSSDDDVSPKKATPQ